jgi:hypothetical protein
MKHHRSLVYTAPPIVSETVVVETHKQHAKVLITKSLGAGITTIGVETVVMPNIDVVIRGILIRFAAKLGSRLSGVLIVWNLSRSLALPATTIGVVGIPQMVFTNPITTTRVNKTTDRSLMSSMVVGGYKSANVVHPRGRYREPIVVIVPILDHKDGHYVRPNMVVFKYPNFEKDVDPNAQVIMFSSVVKINAKTSEEYIINVFSYMLRNMAS